MCSGAPKYIPSHDNMLPWLQWEAIPHFQNTRLSAQTPLYVAFGASHKKALRSIVRPNPEAPSAPEFRNHDHDNNNDDDEFSFLDSAF